MLPQHATLADIATLKNEAYRLAFVKHQLDLAEQLCIRANAAAMGRDIEVLHLYAKIKNIAKVEGLCYADIAMGYSEVTNKDLYDSTLLRAPQGIDEDGLSGTEITKYGHLRDLLKAGQWRQADEETQNLILRLAKRIKARWLLPESIDKLPCQDLCKIDSLWVKYSNQQFGFSVQKKIYAECGGKPDGTYQSFSWNRFCERVGWIIEGEWASYSSFILDLSAPQGQFPSGVRVVRPSDRENASEYWKGWTSYHYVYIEKTNLIGWHYFFARLEACRL